MYVFLFYFHDADTPAVCHGMEHHEFNKAEHGRRREEAGESHRQRDRAGAWASATDETGANGIFRRACIWRASAQGAVHLHFEIRPSAGLRQKDAIDPVPKLPDIPATMHLTEAVEQSGNTLKNK